MIALYGSNFNAIHKYIFFVCVIYRLKTVNSTRKNPDIDLFECLEDTVGIYKGQGRVNVAGDFNSRTSDKADFFNVMYLVMTCIIYWIMYFITRMTPELIHVKLQTMLLIILIFKVIFNFLQRHWIENSKRSARRRPRWKCYILWRQWYCTSVIDYLLVDSMHISDVTHFASGTFTTISDHSPVNFYISLEKDFSEILMQEPDNSNSHRKSVNVRWNTDSVERIRHGLSQCSETLVDICSKSQQCQDEFL